jgi:NYN domain-containing protein
LLLKGDSVLVITLIFWEEKMTVHVFWDNSNIYGGMMDAQKILEPDVPKVAMRIDFVNLVNLVHQGRPTGNLVLAGSVPPECQALWQHAEKHGYDTKLLKRVDNKEQAVDEVLHLRIASTLLELLPHKRNQTIILLTGDGATSADGGLSFPHLLEQALKNGFHCEVYSWSPCLSKSFARLQNNFKDKLKIINLDDFYFQLTFVKAGKYYTDPKHKDKRNFIIGRRSATMKQKITL